MESWTVWVAHYSASLHCRVPQFRIAAKCLGHCYLVLIGLYDAIIITIRSILFPQSNGSITRKNYL